MPSTRAPDDFPRATSAPTKPTRRRCCARWASGRWTSWWPRRCRPTSASRARWTCRAPVDEAAIAGGAARDRWPRTRSGKSFIGMGYSRLHHAAGHPAQHPGEPGLVHRVHAVPGGDLAGAAGGAAQLPDDGHRPDRPADRERVAARRGDRRRRGDAHAARAGAGAERDDAPARTFLVSDDCHPQTIDVVRTRAEAAGHRGARRRRGGVRLRGGQRVFGVLVQYPATDGAVPDYRDLCKRAHAAGALVAMADGSAGADAADAAGRAAAPTSRSAARSASACRSATAARTRRSSRRATSACASCPGA